GTLAGNPLPTWTTGVTGNALAFSGTGGSVHIPGGASLNDLPQQGGLTVVTWVNPSNLVGYQTLVDKGRWNLGLDGNGTFGFGDFCSSGQVGSYSPGGAVPANQWSQLVATWDGTTTSSAIKLYVNGAAIAAYPQG